MFCKKLKNWFKVKSRRDCIRLTSFFTIFSMLAPVVSILTVSYTVYGELTSVNEGLLWLGALIPLLIVPPIGFALLNMLYFLGKSLKKLDAVVKFDPLTGLLTRSFFLSSLESAKNISGVFLMVDADNFKSVNDNYGHHVGDVVLKRIAQCLEDSCPGNAIVGRLGGEEFGIFLFDYQLEDGVIKAWNICQNVRETLVDVDGTCLSVTVSIGAAMYEQSSKLEHTMKFADKCLYQ